MLELGGGVPWRLGASAIAASPLASLAPPDQAGAASLRPPSITIKAPQHVRGGHAARLSGAVADPLGRRLVSLLASPYPYRHTRLIGVRAAAPDGSFSFQVVPDRDTRYRVTLAGTAAAAETQVLVADPVQIKVMALALGQARVTLLVSHPRGLHWGGARVRWSFAHGFHGRFFPEPATRTRESRRRNGVLLMGTTVALPAGHFRFRACFDAPATGALLDPGRPPDCRGWGFSGSGALPAAFPSPAAVRAAGSYLARRAGRTAFAVVDSQGRLSGVHVRRTFVSASVVKAMLLVTYLRGLDGRGQRYIDPYSNSILYPMINSSENHAATAVYNQVGGGGLYRLATRAGMSDFGVRGFWANARISAADQARYFFEVDSLIPREFVGYARNLLSAKSATRAGGSRPWPADTASRSSSRAVGEERRSDS